MRKIIVFNLVSLDGYFAGIDGNIDWHNVDDEFNQFAVEQTKKFGTILFGRVTYQIFEDFWPTVAKDAQDLPAGRQVSKEDLEIANIINNVDKIVFSKTLKKVEEKPNWKNVNLMKSIKPEEIKKLRRQPGKDMVIFGSGTIAQQMTNVGLVDEIRLLVNPVVLGSGKPMFKDPLKLKLLKTRTFRNGNVLLYYVPEH